MNTLTATLPLDAEPEPDPQRDAERTAINDGLLQRGFRGMMFPVAQ